jgi:hypothetical protein
MAIHAPITGAPTRAPSIGRRNLLGALAAAPAAVALALPAAAAHGGWDSAKREMNLPDVDFDAALRNYYCARDIEDREFEQGDIRAAHDAYDRGTKGLPAAMAATGADAEQRKRCNQAMVAAEDLHQERFREPRWAAFKSLTEAPAPSIAALMMKMTWRAKRARAPR